MNGEQIHKIYYFPIPPKNNPLSPLGDPEIYSEISVESISFNKNPKQEDSEQSWASWLNPRKSFNTNLPLKNANV